MQQILNRRAVSLVSPIRWLIVAAGLAFAGAAGAAPPATACPTFEEGGPVCNLAISGPQSVAAGQPFTVTVAITYGEGILVAPNDPCSSQVVVTLNVFISEGPPFATYTANANKGVATFTVGALPPNEGPYVIELDASATQNGGTCSYNDNFLDVPVVTVTADQPVFPCPPDVVCTQVSNNGTGGGTAATLFADLGSFPDATFVPLTAGETDACGILPADPSTNPVLTFLYAGSSRKTIVFALSPGLITQGIGRYNVCWGSNSPFTTLGGGPAAPVSTPLGTLYYGLLPNCSRNNPGPCVLFKTSTQHNGGFFGISAPPTDPRGYVG